MLESLINNNRNIQITIWHPNGEKYFSYLKDFYKVKFENIYFFRKIFRYHKFSKLSKFRKPFLLNKYNLVCLPPFDLNILFFIFGKMLRPNSILILHTSDFLHDNGYIFRSSITKFIYKFCINKWFNLIIYPNTLQINQLNKNYSIPKIYIPHHINPTFLNNNINGLKDIDIIFVGEKSFKKGYDRFIELSNILKCSSYAIGSSFSEIHQSNDLTDIGNLNSNVLSKYLLRSKFLILPSRRYENWEELFSQIAVESICCGAIVLSTNHIGPTFLKNAYKLPIYLFNDDDNFVNNVKDFIGSFKQIEYNFDLSDFKIENLLIKWNLILSNS